MGNSAVIRLQKKDKEVLEKLAKETGQSVPKVVHGLIEDFKKRSFFAGLKSDYAKLKGKKRDWQEYISENELFEGTIADGLNDL
jgi:hypothetical protein